MCGCTCECFLLHQIEGCHYLCMYQLDSSRDVVCGGAPHVLCRYVEVIALHTAARGGRRISEEYTELCKVGEECERR